MSIRKWLYTIPLRLRSLLKQDQVEDELSAEFEFHLAQQIEANLAVGMSEPAARQAALRQFGGAAQRKEECHDARRTRPLEELWHDLRHSARGLRRSPGFTLIAVLSLAAGIGATSALFTVVDHVLLRPLPLPQAKRLVSLDESHNGSASGGNPARLRDWQQARSMQAAGGFYSEGVVLTGQGQPERLQVLRMFGDVPGTLGITPLHGRMPNDKEQRIGAPLATVSHRFWMRRLGGQPVLGRTLRLGGTAYEITAVLQAGTQFPDDIDVWTPAPAAVQGVPRVAAFLGQVGRLHDGVTLAEAEAELRTMAAGLASQYPDTDRGRNIRLVPLLESVTDQARTPLLVLFAGMTAVLLIACVNVSGLLMARGLQRGREAALRAALGAGQGRLVRLFLCEALLLSLLACAFGLALASGLLIVLKRLLPGDLPRLAAATLDVRIVLFALGLAIVVTLLSGLLPALRTAWLTNWSQIKDSGTAITGGRQPLRRALVVAQVALSTVLLVSATLLTSSFARMQTQPLGFTPEHALAFSVNFAWDTNPAKLDNFSRRMEEELSALPGVTAAGVVDRLPLQGGTQSTPARMRGVSTPPGLRRTPVSWRTASPGYFTAAGVPLLQGEVFTPRRDAQSPKVALINQRLAQAFFGGANPIGKQIAAQWKESTPDATTTWYRIIGIVADTRQRPDQTAPSMEVYLPWGESYWPMMSFVVRGTGDPATLSQAIRMSVRRVDPDQVIEDLLPMDSHISVATQGPRTRTWAMGLLSAVALALACVGLFGLLAGESARRQSEFGVRLALGASPASLLLSALQRGLSLALVGLAIGLGLSLWLSRYLQSLLFGVQPNDAATYAVAAALLLLVALVACLVPAQRAASVNPLLALRHE